MSAPQAMPVTYPGLNLPMGVNPPAPVVNMVPGLPVPSNLALGGGLSVVPGMAGMPAGGAYMATAGAMQAGLPGVLGPAAVPAVPGWQNNAPVAEFGWTRR